MSTAFDNRSGDPGTTQGGLSVHRTAGGAPGEDLL